MKKDDRQLEEKLYREAVDVVMRTHSPYGSTLEKELKVTFLVASLLLDRMRREGLIEVGGPPHYLTKILKKP